LSIGETFFEPPVTVVILPGAPSCSRAWSKVEFDLSKFILSVFLSLRYVRSIVLRPPLPDARIRWCPAPGVYERHFLLVGSLLLTKFGPFFLPGQQYPLGIFCDTPLPRFPRQPIFHFFHESVFPLFLSENHAATKILRCTYLFWCLQCRRGV